MLSFMPILHHSLQLFDFYSPSLRRGSVGTGGLRLLSFMPILHHSLQLFDFYSPSLRRGSVGTGGLRFPLLQAYVASERLSHIEYGSHW